MNLFFCHSLNCGVLVEKDQSQRTHKCPFCELSIKRDLDAAKKFSDWDYGLFLKSIDTPYFSKRSSHCGFSEMPSSSKAKDVCELLEK